MTNESVWCGSVLLVAGVPGRDFPRQAGRVCGVCRSFQPGPTNPCPGGVCTTVNPTPDIAVSRAGAREPFCRKTPNLGTERNLSEEICGRRFSRCV